MSAKRAVRSLMLRKMKAQTALMRRKRSRVVLKTLLGLKEFREAGTVCFFVSMPEEVDTRPMIDRAIRDGKKVFVPVCDAKKVKLRFFRIRSRKELVAGSFGILEPRAKGQRPLKVRTADCVLVPGVAFDGKGNRLGRGKGYYDGFLSGLSERTCRIGIGFSFQVVKKVPTERHDQPVDILITDRTWIRTA